jgi:hypothetical protein
MSVVKSADNLLKLIRPYSTGGWRPLNLKAIND